MITIGPDSEEGTYSYSTVLEGNPGNGPVTVKVTGSEGGDVALTIRDDGTAHMVLTELEHSYTAPHAFDIAPPMGEFPIDWEVGGTC